MEITFTEFVGKAPRIEAIEVTSENVEALASWMGATSYSVEKTLIGGGKQVTFKELIEIPGSQHRPGSHHLRTIVTTKVGQWLVKIPKMIPNERFYEEEEQFRSVSRQTIDEFVAQQRDNGEIDFSAAPYDR